MVGSSDFSEAGFIAWDLIEDKIWADDAVAGFLGVHATVLALGLSVTDLIEFVHHEDREELAAETLAAITSGKPWDVTYRLVRNDKSTITVNVIGRCLRYNDGYPTLSTGIMREVIG